MIHDAKIATENTYSHVRKRIDKDTCKSRFGLATCSIIIKRLYVKAMPKAFYSVNFLSL